jgi:signal transduction histidine kinase
VSTPHDANASGDRIAELEQRIAALELEVRRSDDAMRARDEILAVVAHDLRNPLGTIVMGATALVQLGGAGDAGASRIRSVAERIERQANRMTRQLGNLTDFAEIQAGRLAIERAPHAPHEIVVATSELVGPGARERGIAIETRVTPELPAVACDADRIIQALANLCANATKVTPNGGQIELGARPGDAGGIEFFVRDHGPGIDRADTVFEPTWRSEQPGYRGAGFGFSIARGIVDAHGGRIWAETTPGAGTAVYFSLAPGD